MTTAPRIETERLLLTWPTEVQIDAYQQAIVGSAIFDTILWDGPTSDRALHEFWDKQRAAFTPNAGVGMFAVIERQTDRYIGGVGIHPDGDPALLELGYAFAPAVHGRGYATEAVTALVDHGFRDRGGQRIEAAVFVGNTASRRVAEKAGLIYEGTRRHCVCKRGEWLDEWVLAITRPDWERAGRGRSS